MTSAATLPRSRGVAISALLRNNARMVCMVAVCALSAAYTWQFVDRGWIPHDEGQIAQSAERVLEGELPHRDFDEPYTGGLTYLHAAAFRLFGLRLVSLRLVLFLFFLVWVPALYFAMSRLSSPFVAGAATLAAVAWSVPNYFASMPSWYTLFFATFGLVALLRHVETGRTRWLAIAGVAGGCSVLIKITGLYYIAGATTFLVFREQFGEGRQAGHEPRAGSVSDKKIARVARLPGPRPPLLGRAPGLWFVAKAAYATAIVGLVASLIRSQPTVVAVVHFVVPVAAVGLLLVQLEYSHGNGSLVSRVSTLLRAIGPFSIGIGIPVLGFVALYTASGSLADLYRGLFTMPQRRFAYASMPLPPWVTLLPAIPYAGVLIGPSLSPRIRPGPTFTLLFLTVLYVLVAVSNRLSSALVWWVVCHLGAAVVLASVIFLYRSMRSSWPPGRNLQALLLVTAVAAFSPLVEIPFAASIYFCYTVPLIAVALLALIEAHPHAPRALHFGVLVALFGFAIVRMNPGDLPQTGLTGARYQTVPSDDIPRAGIRMMASDQETYARVIRLVKEHRRGRDIYATPDCPEVYFLTGSHNPTRTFYEIFDQRPLTARDLQALVDGHAISVVVINQSPRFSTAVSPELGALVAAEFPHSAAAGRFVVRWRT